MSSFVGQDEAAPTKSVVFEPSDIAQPKRVIGRPFEPGNPGKPKGTRNRATLAAEALLDGEVEALTRRAVELALSGDTTALRLCLDRLLPPRRDRPVSFELPPIKTAEDAVAASGAIMAAVADGSLTPGEAGEVSKLVDTHIRVLEASDFEQRLAKLELESSR
jgi:Family of unknown function (DUF5681)